MWPPAQSSRGRKAQPLDIVQSDSTQMHLGCAQVLLELEVGR